MIISVSDKTPGERIVSVADVVIVNDGNFATVQKDRHGKAFGRSVPVDELDGFIIKTWIN